MRRTEKRCARARGIAAAAAAAATHEVQRGVARRRQLRRRRLQRHQARLGLSFARLERVGVGGRRLGLHQRAQLLLQRAQSLAALLQLPLRLAPLLRGGRKRREEERERERSTQAWGKAPAADRAHATQADTAAPRRELAPKKSAGDGAQVWPLTSSSSITLSTSDAGLHRLTVISRHSAGSPPLSARRELMSIGMLSC